MLFLCRGICFDHHYIVILFFYLFIFLWRRVITYETYFLMRWEVGWKEMNVFSVKNLREILLKYRINKWLIKEHLMQIMSNYIRCDMGYLKVYEHCLNHLWITQRTWRREITCQIYLLMRCEGSWKEMYLAWENCRKYFRFIKFLND